MVWDIETTIAKAEAFTKAYQQAEREHPAIREALCLKAMYPAYLGEIGEGESFAGRNITGIAGYRYSYGHGDIGYYFYTHQVFDWRKAGLLNSELEKRVQQLEEFWRGKTTLNRFEALDGKHSDIEKNSLFVQRDGTDWTQEHFSACYMPRMCEINLDYDKLLQLGLPGLRQQVQQRRAESLALGSDVALFDGMDHALDVLTDTCLHYAAEAEQLSQATFESRKDELKEMAEVLRNITQAPPQTLREAIQLFWIYSVVAAVDNYGRMDVYLGDFLCRDINSGRLSEGDALALLQGLWRHIASVGQFTGRVVIGGLGRRNVQNADRFALTALEASRTVLEDSPQLSLRLYNGINPAIYDKALDVLGEGRNYPMLYNDDVQVPAAAQAFHISQAEAEQYIMSNCGEYDIDHRSLSSPNGSINYLKILELALFNGIDPASGRQMGPKLGSLEDYTSFDALWHAFEQQSYYVLGNMAPRMVHIDQATEQDSPNLFCSILFDDCLEQGMGLVAGARYRGLDFETHGVVSVADCLVAIRRNVFEAALITPDCLLDMLRVNFTGYERERRILLDAPKFGNDHAEADAMALKVYEFVNDATSALAERLGYHYSLASHIGVNANVYLGRMTISTACGRRAGEAISNSLNPLPGYDRNGVTALLNSMARFRPDNVAGQVMHLKLSHALFDGNRGILKTLLNTYFSNGGCYLNIAVMNRDDLQDALVHPEKHQNLMVRIGGFSARFTTLAPEMQRDILARTQY